MPAVSGGFLAVSMVAVLAVLALAVFLWLRETTQDLERRRRALAERQSRNLKRRQALDRAKESTND
jgi:HAMP domain-containing protein